jgi:hypothetical protein
VLPLALSVDRYDLETHEPLPGAIYQLAIGAPIEAPPGLDRTAQRALNAQVESVVRELHRSISEREPFALGNQFA